MTPGGLISEPRLIFDSSYFRGDNREGLAVLGYKPKEAIIIIIKWFLLLLFTISLVGPCTADLKIDCLSDGFERKPVACSGLVKCEGKFMFQIHLLLLDEKAYQILRLILSFFFQCLFYL